MRWTKQRENSFRRVIPFCLAVILGADNSSQYLYFDRSILTHILSSDAIILLSHKCPIIDKHIVVILMT